MSITRRGLLQGFGAMTLTALFRPKLDLSRLVEVSEDDILEEYLEHVTMDGLHPGMEFRMRVRRSGPVNLKSEPIPFRAAIIGSSLEPSPYQFYGATPPRKKLILPISSDPHKLVP